MSYSKPRRESEDFLSNVPDNVADDILGRLPILMAARTSVLSKQWRRNWLSMRRLIFNDDFWIAQNDEDGNPNPEYCSDIISSVLFHHNGPVEEFHLYIPQEVEQESLNHSQWLSFLSKNGVRKISINNLSKRQPIASYIFCCSELEQLRLKKFCLNQPPSGIRCFPKLGHLVLYSIKFNQPEMFSSLIANFRQLTVLRLEKWTGMNQIVIDVPSLKTLRVKGVFESIIFRNVCSLKNVSLSLAIKESNSTKVVAANLIKAVNFLARSCELRSIQFAGSMCQFLAKGCIQGFRPVAFNNLKKLCLMDLDMADYGVFHYLVYMVVSCSKIKELELSVISSKDDVQHKLDCYTNRKLPHLIKIKITGITGSSSELQLVEYLLSVSVVLEKLLIRSHKVHATAEKNVTRALMGFTRASPKARILFAEN